MSCCVCTFLANKKTKRPGLTRQGPMAQTLFAVPMTCEGCVKDISNSLYKLDGISKVEANLADQLVRIEGTGTRASPDRRLLPVCSLSSLEMFPALPLACFNYSIHMLFGGAQW